MKKQAPPWLVVVLSVLAVVGWALHWHLTINNTSPVVKAPTSANDGFMSVAQCSATKAGTSEIDIVAEYGMPKDDITDNGSSDLSLSYPLVEDSSKNCTISFGVTHSKVTEVQLDLIDQQQEPQ